MRTTQTTTIVSVVPAWYSFSASPSVDCHNSKQLHDGCITAGDVKKNVGVTNLTKAEFPGKKQNGCKFHL